MKVLKILFFTLLLSLFFVIPQVQASSNCTSFYGGGYTGSTSCAKIIVNKKVIKPGTKDYVDALSAMDSKFTSGQEVTFQLFVQNVGDQTLTDINVVDTLPQYVSFVSGPGNFDKNANKLTFKLEALGSGESQTFYVVTKVKDNLSFDNNGLVCTTNFVNVSESHGASADDSAQFCIERAVKVEKQVLGLKQTPPTGPEAAALPALLGMAGFGLYLKRKSHMMINKKRGGVTK